MGTVELAPNEKRCSKCKEVKGRGLFNNNKNNKDGLEYVCKICRSKIQKEKYSNKPKLPRKPSKPHLTTRVGDKVKITKRAITFPREYWPEDCNYAKIEISRKEKLVRLRAFNRKHNFTKSVSIPPKGPYGHRLKIYFPEIIINSLDEERDIKLTDGEKKGFIIEFNSRHDPLLTVFERWAFMPKSLKNNSPLSTQKGRISISCQTWPKWGRFAKVELSRFKTDDYLDVLPSIEKIGSKVERREISNRVRFAANKFLNDHLIPSGDWELKEVLPNGALRFRMYRERQPQQEAG